MGTMPYSFPFQPYDLQLKVMDTMYNAIKDEKIGIIESPTGTGKSLMILCVSYTWLQELRPIRVVPKWMKNKVKKVERNSLSHLKQMELGEEEEWQVLLRESNKEEKDNIRPYKPKLIYATRTHSQIASIIKELKKTEFGAGLKVTILGSRKQYCINTNCATLPSTPLNDKCKDLIAKGNCKYFNESMDRFADDFQNRLWDIEDALDYGKQHVSCPYYMSKIAINEADIVICPFQSIINANTRNSFELNLKDCIVVIDEAHNFYDAALQNDCISISFTNLQVFSLVLLSYKSKYSLRLSTLNLKTMELCIRVVNALLILRTMPHLSEQSITTILIQLKLENVNFFELVGHMNKNNFYMKLIGQMKEHELETNFFHFFMHFLELMMNGMEQGCLCISKMELSYLKISPFDTVRQLELESRALLFIAGTLSPINQYIDMICPADLKPKIKSYQAQHIVAQTNFRIQTVSGHKYDWNARNISSMLQTTFAISNCAPEKTGILIFVSSFRILELLEREASKHNSSIIKTAIFESKKSSNISELIKKHNFKLKHSKSLIFAVFGGKLSEGIDFKDDLARTLLIFGIPFPNMEADAFKKRCATLKLRPFDMGLSLAIRSVNQTIGRCLRHINDYAFVFLIDDRYNKFTNKSSYFVRIMEQLSGWIQPNVSHSNSLDLNQYKDFFKSK